MKKKIEVQTPMQRNGYHPRCTSQVADNLVDGRIKQTSTPLSGYKPLPNSAETVEGIEDETKKRLVKTEVNEIRKINDVKEKTEVNEVKINEIKEKTEINEVKEIKKMSEDKIEEEILYQSKIKKKNRSKN